MARTATLACAAENTPRLPGPIPDEWLAPEHHPRLFVFPDGLDAARQVVRETDWGRTFLKQQHERWHRFAAMSDQYAIGKAVYHGDQFVGRIAELNSDARRIRLVGLRLRAYDQAFAARILEVAEVAEGDRVTVAANTITRP